MLLGAIGRYGGDNLLPDWWDLAAVTAFSLAVYYGALRLVLPAEEIAAAVAADDSPQQ